MVPRITNNRTILTRIELNGAKQKEKTGERRSLKEKHKMNFTIFGPRQSTTVQFGSHSPVRVFISMDDNAKVEDQMQKFDSTNLLLNMRYECTTTTAKQPTRQWQITDGSA
uniref:Uncharacterized protein n=1 Tax=Glossina pallidipes TaxID=7398 RepID=A0A1B0AJT6_GLOPL